MRILGQPEGVRRRLDLDQDQDQDLDLDLTPTGELRHVEVVRGRAGYGFTLTAQRPCLLSGILEGSLAARVGLKQGDRVMAVNGTDVSNAPHETVVQLIGTCQGPLRLAVLGDRSGLAGTTAVIGEGGRALGDRKGIHPKVGVFCTVHSDDVGLTAAQTKLRPVSEPDMSHWSQHLDALMERPLEERTEVEDGDDADSDFTDPDEAAAEVDWSILNMTMLVGYLGSTELTLNTAASEDSCLEAIRQRIRQLGMAQDTHTLVLFKVMFDCVRLCDDAGATLAAFPAQNLLLGAVCAEDARFFCLVTTVHINGRRVPLVGDDEGGPLRASCHVFFVDPELARHRDHPDIARRFGFECTPDPDAKEGCLEFPLTPQDVLHFVSVLYSDMGEAVERLRVRLDTEAQLRVPEEEEDGGTGKQGSASSNGDSGIGNASPPEERTDRDFPPAEALAATVVVAGGSHMGAHLPSCPWDYPEDEELAPRVRAQTLGPPHLHRNPGSNLDEGYPLSESLAGPDALTALYGGPPPRLEFQFKPPPPPLPPGKRQNFLGGPLRSSQKWFAKQKWPKGRSGPPEYPKVWPSSISLGSASSNANANFLPPPMSQIPTDRYDMADPGAMLPPKEDWTKRFLEQNGRHRKEGDSKGARFWGKGVRASGRRAGKRLSMARSLDDLELASARSAGLLVCRSAQFAAVCYLPLLALRLSAMDLPSGPGTDHDITAS
ncbi:hypothetical protein CRUP_023657 [Coryphaenoides rupestris]|nr:hypothetical protein CRUP_023657 [Coryphaenoides rupestris]